MTLSTFLVRRAALQGFEIVASTPQPMAKFQADEFTRWKAVIETGKITVD